MAWAAPSMGRASTARASQASLTKDRQHRSDNGKARSLFRGAGSGLPRGAAGVPCHRGMDAGAQVRSPNHRLARGIWDFRSFSLCVQTALSQLVLQTRAIFLPLPGHPSVRLSVCLGWWVAQGHLGMALGHLGWFWNTLGWLWNTLGWFLDTLRWF